MRASREHLKDREIQGGPREEHADGRAEMTEGTYWKEIGVERCCTAHVQGGAAPGWKSKAPR